MKKLFFIIVLVHTTAVVNVAVAKCGISDIKAGTCTGAAAGYGIDLGAGNKCQNSKSECLVCVKDSTDTCNKNTYNITFEQEGCQSYSATCYNGIPIMSCSKCNTGYILLRKQIPWCNNDGATYQVCRKEIKNVATDCPQVFESDWGASSKGTDLIERYSQDVVSCSSSSGTCVDNSGADYCDRFYYYGCADGYYNKEDDFYSKDYKLIKCSKCPTPPETWMQKYVHSALSGGFIEPVATVELCYVGGAEDGLYTDDIGTFEWDGCYEYVE